MFFVFNVTATTEISTYCHPLSLHDALPIYGPLAVRSVARRRGGFAALRHAGGLRADTTNGFQRIMELEILDALRLQFLRGRGEARVGDRKSTRLNSSH